MIPLVNAIAESWFRYMASATFQATLLALLVLGVLRLGRRWPPALRHAILMLALLKFVIPPMLSLPTGIFNRISQQKWAESAPALRHVVPALQTAIRPIRTTMQPAVEPLPEAKSLQATVQPEVGRTLHGLIVRMAALSAKGTLFLLHLSGTLLILVMALLQQFYLRKLALRAGPAQDPALADTYDELCRSLKPMTRPCLLISSDNHAPITFGALKPVVMLPQAIIAALPLPEIRTILGHELAHHRRRDPWLAWIQVIISAAWWFNPVYWLLSRQLRSVREDCCDDLVVSSGIASRESYCRTLLQAARVTCRNPMAGAALAYVGEAQPLHRRFKRIMTAKSIRVPKLARTGMLAVAALGLLLLPGVRPRVFAETSTPVENHVKKLMDAMPLVATMDPHVADAPSDIRHNTDVNATDPQHSPEHQNQTETALPNRHPNWVDENRSYYIVGEAPPAYYLKWLVEDVVYLISPTERTEFLALKTDEERDSFIEQFWARRGPSFKEEHYRRIAYANEHFTSRNMPGWKTDRGRTYIMFGKPDELESHPMGGAYKRPFNEGGGQTTTYPFEKWWYRHIDGVGDNIEIEFVDLQRTGEYRMAMSPWEKDIAASPNSSGSLYYGFKMDYIKRSGEKALWNLTLRIANKDLMFVKQQDLNRATVNIHGKISDVNGRVCAEWEDVINVEYADQSFEEGKARQTEYQKIVVLPWPPPDNSFKPELEVVDANSKKTGTKIWEPSNPFERMEQYFGNADGR